MSGRHVWWWTCDRCSWRSDLLGHLGAAEFARDEHIKCCQPYARRAPWERNISTDFLPIFDA